MIQARTSAGCGRAFLLFQHGEKPEGQAFKANLGLGDHGSKTREIAVDKALARKALRN